MWMDALDLQDFYQTSLGLWVRSLLRSRLRSFVTSSPNQTVLGIGYPLPYLKLFSENAQLALLMPAQQGVLKWPPLESSVSVLAEETAFPFPDACFDVVLCVHALEFSEQTHQMLREIWRVLKESGRLIVLAPNRRSIWSRVEGTPLVTATPTPRVNCQACYGEIFLCLFDTRVHSTFPQSGHALSLPRLLLGKK